MEGSCTDEGSTTSDAVSLSSTLPLPPPAMAEEGGLYRTGSGGSASVILNPAAADVDQQAESKKLPSSKYKGVVPQPNGRWGAQIYEKHQRVWLGTFNDEDEAARSYDVAAQRFRGRDAVINFKPLSDQNDAVEISFLDSHSKSEIVDMLRKHTYSDELDQSRRHFTLHPAGQSFGAGPGRAGRSGAREHLFEKTVTPSDVGKLNRLVIPKQHAEKHFPLGDLAGAGGKGVLLNFEDTKEKVWRFRYSYWNSSQSYVLTKGWSRFVKDKCLKAGDVVVFLRSTAAGDNQHYIDCRTKTTSSSSSQVAVKVTSVVTASIRLFGVDINSEEPGDADGDGNGNGKRGRGDDVVLDLSMSLDYSNNNNNKKMRTVNVELS